MRCLLFVGTRPEAIKLFPVATLGRTLPNVDVTVCFTNQHEDLLWDTAADLAFEYDVSIPPGNKGLSLGARYSYLLGQSSDIVATTRPDVVVVQGDTLSTMAGAQSAFLERVRVAHVEAGLRTGDLQLPWPEEYSRRVIAIGTWLHFAPTEAAARNLIGEGVSASQVEVTGNTAIDTLRQIVETSSFAQVPRPLVLVTSHRRESIGVELERICQAINRLALTHPNVSFRFLAHPNPEVRRVVEQALATRENLLLEPPMRYRSFIELLASATVIVTDSGGIQEEAAALGVPTVVVRDVTERLEAVEQGGALLVGTEVESVVAAVEKLLAIADHRPEGGRSSLLSVYGDGYASARIWERITAEWLREEG